MMLLQPVQWPWPALSINNINRSASSEGAIDLTNNNERATLPAISSIWNLGWWVLRVWAVQRQDNKEAWKSKSCGKTPFGTTFHPLQRYINVHGLIVQPKILPVSCHDIIFGTYMEALDFGQNRKILIQRSTLPPPILSKHAPNWLPVM
jgi:hypothetical protein